MAREHEVTRKTELMHDILFPTHFLQCVAGNRPFGDLLVQDVEPFLANGKSGSVPPSSVDFASAWWNSRLFAPCGPPKKDCLSSGFFWTISSNDKPYYVTKCSSASVHSHFDTSELSNKHMPMPTVFGLLPCENGGALWLRNASETGAHDSTMNVDCLGRHRYETVAHAQVAHEVCNLSTGRTLWTKKQRKHTVQQRSHSSTCVTITRRAFAHNHIPCTVGCSRPPRRAKYGPLWSFLAASTDEVVAAAKECKVELGW